MGTEGIQQTGLSGYRKPISLLYVDDEPGLLEICQLFLEQTPEFLVATSESARDALTLLTSCQYDIIVSDYQMPQMDGLEFLQEVRKKHPDLPFIIFTGRSREEVAISALNAGATFYLQKGGDIESQFAELANEIRLAVNKQRSEKELVESERRYRNVVDSQSEFIVRFAPDGSIIFANNAYCQYFSLDKSASVGLKFRPVIPFGEQCSVRDHFAGLTPDQPSGTMIHRILLPEGEIRWHQWTTTAIYDHDGNLTEYQSVGRDITEIRHAQNLWHTAIDSSSSAIAIIEYNGIISCANQEFADMAGFHSYKEVVGMNITEFILPVDRTRMENYHILRHVKSSFAPHRYSFWFRSKDGTSRTVMMTAGVVPDTKKTLVSIIGIPGQDESGLHLKRMESIYRLIIDHMQEGYYRVDASGVLVQISPVLAEQLGFGPSDILGKSVQSLPIEIDNPEEFMSRLSGEGCVSGFPGFMRKTDGSSVKISITGHVLPTHNGGRGGMEGIIIGTGTKAGGTWQNSRDPAGQSLPEDHAAPRCSGL